MSHGANGRTRGVAVLGSTGSIGESALRVLDRQRDHFRVVALTAGRQRESLLAQVATWRPAFAGIVDGAGGNGLASGVEVLLEAALHPDVDIVINALVGAAGLDATLAALRAGKRVALANKESLVMAGDLVAEAARLGGGEVVPVDSEHSAVLQCVTGHNGKLARLILTASGGPFRGWDAAQVAGATVEQALNHPTWRMGSKITVDSATLANKALEVIEAHFLFGLSYDQVDVVVHPQSIVHAFAEFCDGNVMAQVGFPTMELPILYALTHPDRLPDAGTRRFDPIAAGHLTFEPVRSDIFRAFPLGVAAGRAGGTSPAAFNAANEEAVAAFLAGALSFGRISDVIEAVMDRHVSEPVRDVETVRAADRRAREHARSLAGQPC